MTLPSLGHLQPAPPTGDVTWPAYRALIEDAIANDPRTLQTRIGPSELGTPCDACLVLKLAGTPEKRETGTDWLPTVGKATHGWLEETFAAANNALPAVRYLIEQRVCVGEVAGVDITGHVDLFDLATGVVTDWKVVGAATLKKVKANGPGPTYRTQAHLYGRGLTRRGLVVTAVQVVFLPRNEPSLSGAYVWTEPYDQQRALDALTRADRLATWVQAMGVDAVLQATGGHTGTEFSCSRFDPTIARPGHHQSRDQLAGLIQTPSPSTAGSTAA